MGLRLPESNTGIPALIPPFMGKHLSSTMLLMAGEETSSEDGGDDSSEDPGNPEEQKEEPAEDPEVTALKEKIAELESTFKEKKSTLQYTLEQCEEFSKSGYARKVANMENMRRVRSNIASTS